MIKISWKRVIFSIIFWGLIIATIYFALQEPQEIVNDFRFPQEPQV